SYHADPYHQWPVTFPSGHYGVELFFIISGFVILMTLEKSGNLRSFAISRITRLYPAYWCAVLFTSAVVVALTPSLAPTVPTIAANMTMLQALMRSAYVDPSYWTLTVELVFYLLMVLCFRLRRRRSTDIELYAIGWLIFAAILRSWLSHKQLELP